MSGFVSPQRAEAFCKSWQVSPHPLLSLRQMMRRRLHYISTCSGLTALASHFLLSRTHPHTLLKSTHTHSLFLFQSSGTGYPEEQGNMSYSSEIYSSSSYRKIFGDAPRSGRVGLVSSSSPSRLHSAGYRSSHRTYGSPSAMTSTAYRRTAAPGRVFSSMPDSMVDLTQSTAVTNELKIIRTNEKEQLQGLNDRFVSFIEKVHNLEQQNKVLEAEVTMLRQRNNEPSRLHELYEQEIRELRARVEELTHEKSQMHLDCVQMNDTLERLREKLDEETRLREEAENTLKGYRKDVDDATVARLELEKKVESLLDEIAFLRKVHEEELQELQASLQATQVRTLIHNPAPVDVIVPKTLFRNKFAHAHTHTKARAHTHTQI